MRLSTLLNVLLLCCLLCSPLQAKTLKIATISPEGSFELTQMRQAAKEISKTTSNRVKLKFYPGGVMGNDQAVIRKIRFNQLQGGLVSASSLASFNRDGQVYCLPFAFRSFAEVDHVRPKMDQIIIDGYKKAGFKIFGIAEGGFAHIMSRQPVRTVEDLNKQKVWAPQNDVAAITAVKAYGVNPIPLPVADVRTGLQTGLIDTVAIPPAYGIILQWHTQVKHITELPLLYTYGILAIDNKVFSRLKKEDQQLMDEVIGAAFQRIDRHNRQQNDQALTTLREIGINFVTPDAAQRQVWKEKAASVGEQLVKDGEMSQDVVNTFAAHLDTFRAGQAAP